MEQPSTETHDGLKAHAELVNSPDVLRFIDASISQSIGRLSAQSVQFEIDETEKCIRSDQIRLARLQERKRELQKNDD